MHASDASVVRRCIPVCFCQCTHVFVLGVCMYLCLCMHVHVCVCGAVCHLGSLLVYVPSCLQCVCCKVACAKQERNPSCLDLHVLMRERVRRSQARRSRWPRPAASATRTSVLRPGHLAVKAQPVARVGWTTVGS